MAENCGEEGSVASRGSDWEVVSLTASTYAAAPGPEEFGPDNEDKEKGKNTGHEPSDALFISDEFVFPPSEHENLPIEPEFREIHSKDGNDNADKKLLAGLDDDLHRLALVDGDSSVSMRDAGLIGSNRSNLPCEAWWKRHAVSLYKIAKEPNAFWSITVVVTVMGLVILGQRWQQNK